MVSTDEAKQVFGRAFSRPPRLLFTNPVCFLFSLYYSYIYGRSLGSTITAMEHSLMVKASFIYVWSVYL